MPNNKPNEYKLMKFKEKPRSDFDFAVIDGVLVIYDLDLGGKSVTNDIEAVLRFIDNKIDMPSKIIYRDSSDKYDGVAVDEDNNFKKFIPMREPDRAKAIKKVKKL